MMTTPVRLLLVVLASSSLAACSQPKIVSGAPRPAGYGGAPPARGGGGTDGPGFSVSYPEAGAPEGPPAVPGALGGGASCAGESHQGKLVPLDLLFLIDISGSMEESAGAQSKWVALREALLAFVGDPKSAGLGVGMETFPPPPRPCMADGDCGRGAEVCEQKGVCNLPASVATTEAACDGAKVKTCTDQLGQPCTVYGICTRTGLRCANMGQACAGGMAGDMCQPRPRFCTDHGGAACPPARYQTPIVAIADLPGVQSTLQSALAAIVPQGTTPTTPAVQGALAHLRMRAMTAPDRKPVLVLATDGLPTECGLNTVDTVVTAVAAAQTAAPAISTYVIGIFGNAQLARSRPALEQMATAGGTGMPFVLATGTDLSQRFLEAINQIRGAALGCEFAIPPPNQGTLDFDRVNVRFNSPAGTDDLRYVESADRCDAVRGGWYYDVNPRTGTPTRVLLCDATCTRVKTTAGVSIDLRFGCKTIIE